MKCLASVLTVVIIGPLPASWAQLYAPNAEGVTMGHLHTIVRNVESTKKFWIGLGGKPIKIDETEVIRMPGFFIFLTPGMPTGVTVGSVVNHAGFFVPNVREIIAKWQAAGLTAEQGNVLDGYAYTPDDLKLEIKLDEEGRRQLSQSPDAPDIVKAQFKPGSPSASPSTNHSPQGSHIHIWISKSEQLKVQAWYFKMFGATPGPPIGTAMNPTNDGIPGLHMSISNSITNWQEHGALPVTDNPLVASLEHPPAPIKGRTLDHIGFEIRNLEAFCRKLEAKGVKFDTPYSKSRHKSFASAVLTDPWGVSIELTEGLNRF